MKVAQFLLIIIIFFLLALLQNSFLPYFSILGQTPNLLLILFFLLTFFEKPNQYFQGFFLVGLAGFFLDVFLPYTFGLSIVALLLIYFFIKAINYFFQKSSSSYDVLYFLGIFTVGFILNQAIFFAFAAIFHFPFEMHATLIIRLIYNIIFAAIGFYLYKNLIQNRHDNQLKLF